MNKERDNKNLPIPQKPHPLREWRVGFVHANYPKPNGPRIAEQIHSNNGYIRGAKAQTHYEVLKPLLNSADYQAAKRKQ